MAAPAGPFRACFVHFASYEIDPQVQRPVRALARAGAHVDVVGLGGPDRWDEGRGSVSLHPVPGSKSRAGLRRYVTEYAGFLGGALRVVASLDRHRELHLVQVHNMPDALVMAGLVPRLRGCALILQIDDTFPELLETLSPPAVAGAFALLARLEERVCAGCANHLITVTPEVSRLLAERGVGRGKTTAILNTPDPAVFGPPRPGAPWTSPRPLRVMYHGGLSRRYGVEVLIDAFGLLERRGIDATLSIYGLFDEVAHLRERARQVAPRSVTLAAAPTRHCAIPAAIAGHHAGVVPTVLDPFTQHLLPVKLLEYVHMGLPVVASRLPLVEATFRGGVRLVGPASAEALADGVEALARASPNEVDVMLRTAHERLAELAPGRQAARYRGVARSVAAHSRRDCPSLE